MELENLLKIERETQKSLMKGIWARGLGLLHFLWSNDTLVWWQLLVNHWILHKTLCCQCHLFVIQGLAIFCQTLFLFPDDVLRYEQLTINCSHNFVSDVLKWCFFTVYLYRRLAIWHEDDVCNVPVLSQNDSTYHHSVFTAWKWHPFATWTPSFIILVWRHHPPLRRTVFACLQNCYNSCISCSRSAIWFTLRYDSINSTLMNYSWTYSCCIESSAFPKIPTDGWLSQH